MPEEKFVDLDVMLLESTIKTLSEQAKRLGTTPERLASALLDWVASRPEEEQAMFLGPEHVVVPAGCLSAESRAELEKIIHNWED